MWPHDLVSWDGVSDQMEVGGCGARIRDRLLQGEVTGSHLRRRYRMQIFYTSLVDQGSDGPEDREIRVVLLSLGLVTALMSTASSAEIKVASSNLNNLHHQLDEPL
jgi:hypothetical protein